MALEYFLYNTGYTNTLVDRSNTSFAPSPPYDEIQIDYFIPNYQPLYYYRESGGTIVINSEANINTYLQGTAPTPKPEDSVTYNVFTGETTSLQSQIQALSGGSVNIDTILTVAPSGATFTSIQAAIDSVTDASTNKRYLIQVYNGTYVEDISMKNYVFLQGINISTVKVNGDLTIAPFGFGFTKLNAIEFITQDRPTATINTIGLVTFDNVVLSSNWSDNTAFKSVMNIEKAGLIQMVGDASTLRLVDTYTGTTQTQNYLIHALSGSSTTNFSSKNGRYQQDVYGNIAEIGLVLHANPIDSEITIDDYDFNANLHGSAPTHLIKLKNITGGNGEIEASDGTTIINSDNSATPTILTSYVSGSTVGAFIDYSTSAIDWNENIEDEDVYIGAAVTLNDRIRVLNVVFKTEADTIPDLYTADGNSGEEFYFINNGVGTSYNSEVTITESLILGGISGNTANKIVTQLLANSTGSLVSEFGIREFASDPENIIYSNTGWTGTTSTVEGYLNETTHVLDSITPTGYIASGSPVLRTGALEITVFAGEGYIIDNEKLNHVTWSGETIDTSAFALGQWYIYADVNGVISTSQSVLDSNQYIGIGGFLQVAGLSAAVLGSGRNIGNFGTKVMNNFDRTTAFIYDKGGKVSIAGTTDVVIEFAPMKVQNILDSYDINETVYSTQAGTKFFTWFYTVDAGWIQNYNFINNDDGSVNLRHWNDTTGVSNYEITGGSLTFTSGSTTVTAGFDLSTELIEGYYVYLQSDGITKMNRIVGITGNTLTLKHPYGGSTASGTTLAVTALLNVPDDKYIKHLVYRDFNGIANLVYNNQYQDTLNDIKSEERFELPGALGQSVVRLAELISTASELSFEDYINDIRPIPHGDYAQTSSIENVSIHGELAGLSADDHLQYSRTDGTRDITGIQSYDTNYSFTGDTNLITKKYVDDNLGNYVPTTGGTFTGAVTGTSVQLSDNLIVNGEATFTATDAGGNDFNVIHAGISSAKKYIASFERKYPTVDYFGESGGVADISYVITDKDDISVEVGSTEFWREISANYGGVSHRVRYNGLDTSYLKVTEAEGIVINNDKINIPTTIYGNTTINGDTIISGDGATAFQIQNSTGDTVINVNTLSGLTGFGTENPIGVVHAFTPDDGGADTGLFGIAIDGADNVDKDIVWLENGILKWAAETRGNQEGDYWYLRNAEANNNALTISESGRFGINKQTSTMDYDPPQVIGTGLNDLELSGLYSETYDSVYEVQIYSTSAATDTYRWRVSIDNGFSYGNWSTPTGVTTIPTPIEYGVEINFNNLTGHTVGDTWRFGGFSQEPQGTLTLSPIRINKGLFTEDYTAGTIEYDNITGSVNGGLAGQLFSIFTTGATATYEALYVGFRTEIESLYFDIDTPASNLTLLTEYYNGSTWTALTFENNGYIDLTQNLTFSDKITWNSETMTDWNREPLPDLSGVEDLRWIRFRTTTTPSIEPQINSMSVGNNKRLAVYNSFNDYRPSFYVNAKGRVNVGGGTITRKNQFQINDAEILSVIVGSGSILETDAHDPEAADHRIKLTSEDACSAGVVFVKTRGDLESTTSIQNGDELGHIWWRAKVGTTPTTGATLASIVSEYKGDGTYQSLQGDIVFNTADTSFPEERVRITSSGTTGFGETEPTALVHLGVGTTTIAPLKFNTGTSLGSPQEGAVEFDGTSWYGTITGDTRKTFAFLESPVFTGTVGLPTGTTIGGDNLIDFILTSGGSSGTGFVTTTDFNTYTGDTDTRLDGIDDDITYISGVTDTKLPTATFNAYTGGTIAWDKVNKTGSDLADLETRNASDVNYTEANWEITEVDDALNKITDYIENTEGSGRLSPEEVLFGVLTDTVQISGGTGFIVYENFYKKITWEATGITWTGNPEGLYYVYVDSGSEVQISATDINATQNIRLGVFYWNGVSIGTLISSGDIISNSTNKVNDFLTNLGYFIYDDGGDIGLYSGSTLKIVSPSCKIQVGALQVQLREINPTDVNTFDYRIPFYSADIEWSPYRYLVRTDGVIPTDRWNDTTKDGSESLTGYSLSFTNGSAILTSVSDLTSVLSDDDHIRLSGDSVAYEVPISGVSWNGSVSTVTLEATYLGSTDVGTAIVNRALPKIPTGKYVKTLVSRTTDNVLAIILGQELLNGEDEAVNAILPGKPEPLKPFMINMAYTVYSGGTSDLTGSFYDIRPLPFSLREGGQTGGGGAITVHANLSGLSADDHLQYLRTDGTRNITAIQRYSSQPTFTTDLDIVSKKYVDDQDALKLDITDFNSFTGTTLPADYYNKTEINSYTGTTDTRLDGIDNDITYISGVTDTKLDLTGGTITSDLKVEGDIYLTGTTPTTQEIEDSYLLGAITADGRIIKTNSPTTSIIQRVVGIGSTTGITELYGIYYVDTTSGDVTLTIPDASAGNDGSGFRVIKAGGSNDVIVTTIGGQDIGNKTSQTITQSDKGFAIVSDGEDGKWLIVQDSRFLEGNTEGELQYWDVDTNKWKVTGTNILWGDTTNRLTVAGSICTGGLDISGNTTIGGTTTLVGVATAPTATVNTCTTQIATTAFVLGQASSTTPLVNSGSGAVGTSNRYSRQDHVHPIDASRLAVSLFNSYSADTATELSSKAPTASPALTGVPTAPTATVGTNTTQIATTAYYIGSAANSNPLMNNTVSIGTSTRFARQDHVHPKDTAKANLAGGAAFTGTITVPKPVQNDNTTCVATTSWYVSQAGTANPLVNGSVAVGTSLLFSRQDHVHPTDTSRQAVITGAATTITSSNLTTDRVLISNGSGKVAVSTVTSAELIAAAASVYGSEFQLAQSLAASTTSATTPQTKVSMTTTNLPAGTYKILVAWRASHTSISNSAYFDVTVNGTPQGTRTLEKEYQETDNVEPLSVVFYVGLSGVNTIAFRYWNESNDTTVSDATIELIRVS